MFALKLIKAHYLLILILFLAALLRFWRLESLTTFSADQGYDFLIVKRMITDGEFTLLGPKIGPYNQIGNLYLGPAYYYLIAPFLLITSFDPIGPAILTTSLAIATIFIIYLIGIKFFSKPIATVATFIYALNSFLVNQSRATSNPHLIPFFSAVFIYSMFMLFKKPRSLIWAAICGISVGIAFQLHYLASSLLLTAFIFLVTAKRFKTLTITLLAFIVTISGQIIFELRHDFFITNLLIKQLKAKDSVSGLERFFSHLSEAVISLQATFLKTDKFTIPITICFFLIIAIFIINNRSAKKLVLVLISSIFLALLLASFYSGSLGLHYFASIYPIIALLISAVIVTIFKLSRHLIVKIILTILIFQIITIDLMSLNLNSQQGYTMPVGWNLIGIKKASKIIAEDIQSSQIFNIAATLDGDTRARPYRYLVEVYGKKPQDVELYPTSEVIYLIARGEENTIYGYTVWEVSSFMPFEIKAKWDIQNGIRLFKLERKKEISH